MHIRHIRRHARDGTPGRVFLVEVSANPDILDIDTGRSAT